AEHVHVGSYALVVTGEGVPGAAQPGLDLVGDEEDPAPRAQLAYRGQVAVGRYDHAVLALDRLQEHRHGGVVDRVGERGGVAVRDDAEPGGVRPEAGAGGRVDREADDGGRPPVEVA